VSTPFLDIFKKVSLPAARRQAKEKNERPPSSFAPIPFVVFPALLLEVLQIHAVAPPARPVRRADFASQRRAVTNCPADEVNTHVLMICAR
jgi:hypothetical protein